LLLNQLLDSAGYLLSLPLASGDDQDRVVTRDGTYYFTPPDLVQGLGDCPCGATRRLQHQEWADTIDTDEQGGKHLSKLGPDCPAMGMGVVRAAPGIGQLGQSQLSNVARQGGLGNHEAFISQSLAETVLAFDATIPHDSQDSGMTLSLHIDR
jgi:hypothetical protein